MPDPRSVSDPHVPDAPVSDLPVPGGRVSGTNPAAALSRRTLLVGALAAGALAACGSDDSGDAEPESTAIDSSGLAYGTYTVVQRFPQTVQVPGGQRLPMSLSTGSAELIQDGPATLGAVVVDLEGTEIGPRLTAKRRDVEPAPYYDFHTAVSEVGIYALLVDGGPEDGASFQVTDPADVTVPVPGAALPPFDTPTFDDPRGVDPVCTRDPEPCPFHDVTLTAALDAAATEGRLVAYYIGTPALCQTGSCTPALESMIDLQDEFADSVTFVHAEVYADDTATTIAPAVEAAGLSYEPALFITDSDGVVVDRLDAVWDVTELRETLLRAIG